MVLRRIKFIAERPVPQRRLPEFREGTIEKPTVFQARQSLDRMFPAKRGWLVKIIGEE